MTMMATASGFNNTVTAPVNTPATHCSDTGLSSK